MKRLNDSTVETRVSRTVLAELAMGFTDHEERPRSISELLRMSLELLADYFVNSKLTVRVDSVADATTVLNKAGLGALNKGGRGKSVLLKALQQEQHGTGYDTYVPLRRRAKVATDEEDEELTQLTMRLQGCSREEAIEINRKGLEEYKARSVAGGPGELTDEERIRLKDEKLKKGLADEVPEVTTDAITSE